MRRRLTTVVFLLFLAATSLIAAGQRISQPPRVMNAAELELAIRKLDVVGSALYIAAHPDDENTALLAYLSKERLVRTGYLSLTRGEGGQNLIGSEKGALLGAIRTQELLAAREVDGAEQFFSRAIDFGYSKSPDETLRFWKEEDVLGDLVYTIRLFQPDLIITRFPATGEGTHGHHTASAMLANEAFVAAADPKRFPAQLTSVKPWQAKRIFWNAWRPQIENRPETMPKLISVDLGSYNKLLGRSYAEVAAESRTFHKSQGFGSAERRGSVLNYFELTAGDPAANDLFDGVDVSWKRIPGGPAFSAIIKEAIAANDASDPTKVIPLLVRAHGVLSSLPDSPIVEAKRDEMRAVVRSAAALWIEAVAARPEVTPASDLQVAVTLVSRSAVPVVVRSAKIRDDKGGVIATSANGWALEFNKPLKIDLTAKVAADARPSSIHWINEGPRSQGSIAVPDAIPSFVATIEADIAGAPFSFELPVLHRVTDPVHGELYTALRIVPQATARFNSSIYLFPDNEPARIAVAVQSNSDQVIKRTVGLAMPYDWSATPQSTTVELKKRGDEATVTFVVTPPKHETRGNIRLILASEAPELALTRFTIDYPHIPKQEILYATNADAVAFDFSKSGTNIGYVAGSGDDIPQILRQLGYKVTLLTDEELLNGDLGRFDAISLGVRAYNTRPRLAAAQQRLFDYVERGGTLVVQYNTLDPDLPEQLGPHPFKLSRDRVTDEYAQVGLLSKDHPALLSPNKINGRDFAGWTQERGLYFPNEWSSEYTPLFAMNDAGEPATRGSVIVAKHGKGTYVYTGLSFFRQLPVGVPGAIRIFANLLAKR